MSRSKSTPYHQGYEMGSWKASCDRCGRLRRSYQLQKEWTGLMCCSECWEPKHPQLDIKGIPDNVNVEYARPRRGQPGDGDIANPSATGPEDLYPTNIN